MGSVVKTPRSWLDLWLLNHPSSHLSQPFQMLGAEQQRSWGHNLCCRVRSRRRGVLSASNCLRIYGDFSNSFFFFFFFPPSRRGSAFQLSAVASLLSQGCPGGFRALLGRLTAAFREFGVGPCLQQDLQCGAGLRLCFGAGSSRSPLVWG